ncbi:MAG TPA: hypothetical protein P5119_01355 [Candidatus Aminicenantes bacterium]|nr:hypothetical protein [Candidatus Aminicenantes bacterium]HRY63972.1 hypothetical protein [Candidatus Aminicenantes bacterium]HRZ70885.1 hypothetical protein [Candidatus Aminicenantes bacterium]
MTKRNLLTIAAGILILAAAAAAAAPADPTPFLGAWKGTLRIAGAELEIGLAFKLDEAKAICGTCDSISQGAFGLALAGIDIKDKTITFLIDGVPGDPTFKGTIDETGKKIAGEFTQGGSVGTFAVEKQ